MRPNRTQKIVVEFLIFSQIIFWPVLVFAQTANPLAPLNPVPIVSSGSLTNNNAFNIILTEILTTAPQSLAVCTTVEKAFEKTDNAAQLGFSFSALIGGDGAYATQLGQEIIAYNTYLGCLQGDITLGFEPGVLPALNSLPAPDTYTNGIKQQSIAQVTATIQTYKAKLAAATARFNVASQNVWKALIITILINTTKTVADQLVNKLVSNYKITNLKQYVNSVATLMYDNQFLRDNFPASQDQLMARQVLTNPLFRSQIQPGIYIEANNALGYNPATLSPSDPNFYSKMAMAGSSPANPYFLQTALVSGVDQSHNSAINTAQAQISQGSGYKAPVNCAGSLAQQQQIDAQANAAQTLVANRQALLTNLQNNGGSAADIKKAQSDLNAAQTTWQNLPYTVTGNNAVGNASASGGNNTEGTMAIVMCEAISSPAVLVNQGIDAVFKGLGANLSQYNNSNLPGYLSAISGIATQIGSSLVLGGIGAAPSSAVTLNENQAITNGITATAGASIQTFNNASQSNLANGINFNITPNSAITNGYTVSWSVVTSQQTLANFVTISGTGFNATTKLPLSGSQSVIVPAYSNYVLTVYDGNSNTLGTATNYISPLSTNTGTNGGLTYNSSAPTVAGAFTSQPVLNIRGPAATITPRGD